MSSELTSSRSPGVVLSCPLTLLDDKRHMVHGILQARILEWVAIPVSRGFSKPSDQMQVMLQADSLPAEPPGKPNKHGQLLINLIISFCKEQFFLNIRTHWWKKIISNDFLDSFQSPFFNASAFLYLMSIIDYFINIEQLAPKLLKIQVVKMFL